MAKKVIIDIEAKTDKAEASLADVVKELKKLNKQSVQTTEQLDEGLKDVKDSAKNAGKGFLSFSNILKGGFIITALTKGFKFFKDVLQQNQTIVNAFNTSTEFLSILFNDIIGTVIEAVSSFDNFKAAIGRVTENLKTLLMPPIIRVQKLIKGLQLGFKALFQPKDSEGILRLTNEMKELDEKFVEAKEDQIELVEAGKEFVTETIKQAKANVELNRTAEKAAVINQGLIEKFDILAEQQRQIRDEERNTIDERIAANNKLKEVLEEQAATMKANAEQVLAAAQAQFDKNKTDKNFIALQEAKNELLAVEAQVTGFMSEQKVNDLALEREKQELTQSNIDAEAERAKAQRDFNAEQIENDVLRIQKQQENSKIEKQEELDRLIAKRDAYTLGTQAFADAENERLAFIQEANNRETELGNELIEAKKKQAEEERNIEKQKITDKQMVLDAISQFADAESGIGKALLIAKQALALQETLLDVKRITFKGTKAVAEAGVDAAQNVSESSKIGFPQNIITIAAAIAQGIGIIRSVKKAVSKTKVPIGGASAEVPQVATPSGGSLPPAFNVVGAGGINQLATAIGEQQQQPVKAFVVSNDVSTAQELDRNIVQGAAIG
jgi:hypothetical protein